MQVTEINTNKINPPSDPDRFRPGTQDLNSLADSIRQHGLINPIGISGPDDNGQYEIVHGHRRFLAVQLLGQTKISANIYTNLSHMSAVRLTENIQRSDLSPLEAGTAILRMREREDLTQSDLALLLNKSESWVKKMESLTRLPEDLMVVVQSGDLPASSAIELSRIDTPQTREWFTDQAIQFGASQRVIREWVRNWLREQEGERINPEVATNNYQASSADPPSTFCETCGVRHSLQDLRTVFLCSECLAAIKSH